MDELNFKPAQIFLTTIMIIIKNNILRGGLHSPGGGFQEDPRKIKTKKIKQTNQKKKT